MKPSVLAARLGLVVAFSMVPLAVLPAAAATSARAVGRPGGAPTLHRIEAAPRLPVGTTSLGTLPAASVVTGAVVLEPADEGALASFIGSVTDRDSPTFHDYLAPGEFRGRFGPSRTDIAAVVRALGAGGLTVTGIARDGLLVGFRGTAQRADATFHTAIERYRLANGSAGQGTTRPISLTLPAAVARDVVSVLGLDDLVHVQPAGILRGTASARRAFPSALSATPHAAPGAPSACSAAQKAAQSYGGLTDDEIANAYGASGLYGVGDLAAGQHVAVYELEPFSPSDIEAFDDCYFGPTKAAAMSGTNGDLTGSLLSVTPVDGGQAPGEGSGESLLDIEDVSAMASDANVDVYEAPNTTFGGLDEYSTIINADADQIVTSSWGVCEQLAQVAEPGLQQAENVLFEQAAAQGQTVLSAAGDTGADSCNESRLVTPPSGQNVLSVLDPASQPYVVSVGGTTIDDASQPPDEHVWNDGASWGGGGGGISESWAMPSWQQAVALNSANSTDVTNAESLEGSTLDTAAPFATPTFCDGTLGLAPGTPCRETPDVSAQADEFTGAVTVYGFGSWFTIGGTSSATPIWAAMLALVNASTTCSSDLVNGVQDVGFASPILYGVAANPAAYAASFNDVTTGNNDVFGLDDGTSFEARSGYDMASGLGSPQLTSPADGPGLAYYLCSYGSVLAPPTVSSVGPTYGTTAGGEVVTVTGTGFGTVATPKVQSVSVGAGTASSFGVVNNTTLQVTLPPATATTPPTSPDPTEDGAGAAQIVVTLDDGESSAPSASSIFEYVDEVSGNPVPSVTSLSPYGGLQTSPATVTVFGSGFSSVESVDFGGVAATNVHVVSPFELTATPPAYSALTPASACPTDNGVAGARLNPGVDVCQVEVTVTTSTATSATATILPPYEGLLTFDSMGAEVLPSACACEDEPQTTEYDYVPAPTVTGVSTGTIAELPGNAATLASEYGGAPSDVVQVTGTGMDPLTFGIGFFGSAADQLGSFYPVEESGTSIVLEAPAIAGPGAASASPVTLPLGVSTLGGSSAASAGGAIAYAGIPHLTGVVNTSNSRTLGGSSGAPDTGGAPLALSGVGFLQAVGPIQFSDSLTPYSFATQSTYAVLNDGSITAESLAQNPGIMAVLVCSTTGCAPSGGAAGELVVYPPGAPDVTSVAPGSGSSTGGASVEIHGSNLGCVTGVDFGTRVAGSFTATQAILDCGRTDLVAATAPPGPPGTTVRVVVKTAESVLTGDAPASTASFHYAGALGSPFFTSAHGATAVVGRSFSFTFVARGSSAVTWRCSGALPKGLRFTAATNGTARLKGEPATMTGGTYLLHLTATDHSGSITQAFTLTVDQRPSIKAASTWSVREGVPASFVMTTTGYPVASDSVTGYLPPGLSVAAGSNGTLTISGTPELGSHGTYRVQLVARNTVGGTHQPLTITVHT